MFDRKDSILSLARVQSAWKHAPHELLSLWDMIEFPATELRQALYALKRHSDTYRLRLHQGEASALGDILNPVCEILEFSDRLGLLITSDRCLQVKRILERAIYAETGAAPAANLITSHCGGIADSLEKELGERRFAFIPKEKAGVFESKALFGDLVSKRFPPAAADIKEAGNCMALGLNQAAVYYLMRVMEFGLLLLHKRLLGKPPKNPNWHNVIEAIETEIRDRDRATRTAIWKRQRGFYIECANQFYFFKDQRNKAVHVELSLENYAPPDNEKTRQIFEHVRGFVQHLATKLKA